LANLAKIASANDTPALTYAHIGGNVAIQIA